MRKDLYMSEGGEGQQPQLEEVDGPLPRIPIESVQQGSWLTTTWFPT